MSQINYPAPPVNWQRLILWISLLLWLKKGIAYALIGRNWILALTIFLGWALITTYNTRPKLHRMLLRFWGLYLMIWGLIRVVLGTLIKIFPISDLHVSQNFDWLGNLYSIGSLVFGWILFRKARTKGSQKG